MQTVDFERLGLRSGELLLDLGCGAGRHTFMALKAGADVVAVDLSGSGLAIVKEMCVQLKRSGQSAFSGAVIQGNALSLPFDDDTFDRVIASEVLEHIPDDNQAIAEIQRVLRPGGTAAVTVPRYWPERICWALSRRYTAGAGGHVRIYRAPRLVVQLQSAGFRFVGSHHAHALHSPYWWIKCLAGIDRDDALPVRLYKRFLEWQIVTRPRPLDGLERVLDPILGKSLVIYARKPDTATQRAKRVA